MTRVNSAATSAAVAMTRTAWEGDKHTRDVAVWERRVRIETLERLDINPGSRSAAVCPWDHRDLWRAIDEEGHILDILVQHRYHKTVAKASLRKLLKGLTYISRVMVTDTRQRDGAAKPEVLASGEHRQHRPLNHWAAHAHQPTRQRERRIQRFKSPRHAQRLLSAYGPMAQRFRPRCARLPTPRSRQAMVHRCQSGGEMTGPKLAASGASAVQSYHCHACGWPQHGDVDHAVPPGARWNLRGGLDHHDLHPFGAVL